MSSGCDAFNLSVWDDLYSQRDTGVFLEVGEVITFEADFPVSGDEPVSGILLAVGPFGTPPDDLTVVDTAGFPGTVSYTVPSSGDYRVLWSTRTADVPSAATWSVSCELPDEDPGADAGNAGQCVKTEVRDRAADPSIGAGPGALVDGTLHSPLGKGNAPFDTVTSCPKP